MRSLTIHGHKYISIREVSKAFEIGYERLRRLSDKQIVTWCSMLPPPTKAQIEEVEAMRACRYRYDGVVEYKGKTYSSIDAAAEALGIKRISLIRTIKRGGAKLQGKRPAKPKTNIISITDM